MDRRTLLKLMLTSALAEAVDFEKLLWTPKAIVTVPAMPHFGDRFIRPGYYEMFGFRDDGSLIVKWHPLSGAMAGRIFFKRGTTAVRLEP